jgi:C4-dicarboxylate-binding protein DctP
MVRCCFFVVGAIAWAVANAQTITVLDHPAVPASRAINYLQKELDARSQGRLRIRLISGLASAPEAFNMTKGASADLALLSTAYLATVEPAFQVFDLPFLFEDLAAVSRFQESAGGEILRSRLKNQGVEPLAYIHEGMTIVSSGREIRKASDFKGLKLGTTVPLNEPRWAQIEIMGAAAVQISLANLKDALATGAIDGFSGPLRAYAGAGLASVQPYI